MSNKSAYKFHPAAELFPLMNKAELEELAVDIKKKGLIAEIVRDKNGLILEGRNRLEACRIAGVEPRFGKYLGNDPVGFIVSANIPRRATVSRQRSGMSLMISIRRNGRWTKRPAPPRTRGRSAITCR